MSISFLKFRQAKRKAKEIVTIRSPRSQARSPPSSSSSVFPTVVEIGDPSRISTESSQCPAKLHVDVDIASGPLFPSDTSLPGFNVLLENAGQSQDQVSCSGPSGTSSELPYEGAKSTQQTVRNLSFQSAAFELRMSFQGNCYTGSTDTIPRVPEDTIPAKGECETSGPRCTTKSIPSPIKIPLTPRTSKTQIQRSTDKSAVTNLAGANSTDSPILDDSVSVASGITIPGTLIANVWTVHTDQPRDHRLSRRITRTDSATLPRGEGRYMNSWRYTELINQDGEILVPPVPPLPSGISDATSHRPKSDEGERFDRMSSSGDQDGKDTTIRPPELSPGRPQETSPISELSLSSPETPDLINDSGISAGVDSPDTQLQMSSASDSAPSAWSGQRSDSEPVSGEEITIFLNLLSASKNSEFAPGTTEPPQQPSHEPAGSSATHAAVRQSGSLFLLSVINDPFVDNFQFIRHLSERSPCGKVTFGFATFSRFCEHPPLTPRHFTSYRRAAEIFLSKLE
jgi:hypothetical protein